MNVQIGAIYPLLSLPSQHCSTAPRRTYQIALQATLLLCLWCLLSVLKKALERPVLRSKRGCIWPFNAPINVVYSLFKGYRLELKTTVNFKDLERFISTDMRMSHVYQPAMLKVLLINGGEAEVNQIAKHLLSLDQPQIEYYEHRTKTMVGDVLTNKR